jgi:membrane-associated phospholipid phosphatase
MTIFITDFADQAVILPLVGVIWIALLAQRWWRGAIAWMLAIGATFAVLLVLKLAFIACWRTFGTFHLHTPSGHVAAATVIVGGLGAIVLRRSHAVAVAFGAAGLIGATRLLLGVHSTPEVILGALVGLGGTLLMIIIARSPPKLRMKPIVFSVALVLIVFHGLHLPAEAHIRLTALRVAKMLAVCQ